MFTYRYLRIYNFSALANSSKQNFKEQIVDHKENTKINEEDLNSVLTKLLYFSIYEIEMFKTLIKKHGVQTTEWSYC